MDNNAYGIAIRQYRPSDAESVRSICIETLPEIMAQNHMEKLALVAFCNYYIKHEPSCCFVAATEAGDVVGYILCAENAKLWSETYLKSISPLPDCDAKEFLETITETPLSLSEEYPAHLHVDILPEFQRMGIGTRLVDALVQELGKRGVPGLMLCVNPSNEMGIRFYLKYGFEILDERPYETVMGLTLKIPGTCYARE
ncbi:MAG: GNAT family N-acetyltransferase [Clostridiales bacterium]|jgi:ribosomal protein S18 acetylase RimI-like enzyme|nr:GNAT family N-acetyltransferase [Clostridiales bacterium]